MVRKENEATDITTSTMNKSHNLSNDKLDTHNTSSLPWKGQRKRAASSNGRPYPAKQTTRRAPKEALTSTSSGSVAATSLSSHASSTSSSYTIEPPHLSSNSLLRYPGKWEAVEIRYMENNSSGGNTGTSVSPDCPSANPGEMRDRGHLECAQVRADNTAAASLVSTTEEEEGGNHEDYYKIVVGENQQQDHELKRQTVVVEKLHVRNLLNTIREQCGDLRSSRLSEYKPTELIQSIHPQSVLQETDSLISDGTAPSTSKLGFDRQTADSEYTATEDDQEVVMCEDTHQNGLSAKDAMIGNLCSLQATGEDKRKENEFHSIPNVAAGITEELQVGEYCQYCYCSDECCCIGAGPKTEMDATVMSDVVVDLKERNSTVDTDEVDKPTSSQVFDTIVICPKKQQPTNILQSLQVSPPQQYLRAGSQDNSPPYVDDSQLESTDEPCCKDSSPDPDTCTLGDISILSQEEIISYKETALRILLDRRKFEQSNSQRAQQPKQKQKRTQSQDKARPMSANVQKGRTLKRSNSAPRSQTRGRKGKPPGHPPDQSAPDSSVLSAMKIRNQIDKHKRRMNESPNRTPLGTSKPSKAPKRLARSQSRVAKPPKMSETRPAYLSNTKTGTSKPVNQDKNKPRNISSPSNQSSAKQLSPFSCTLFKAMMKQEQVSKQAIAGGKPKLMKRTKSQGPVNKGETFGRANSTVATARTLKQTGKINEVTTVRQEKPRPATRLGVETSNGCNFRLGSSMSRLKSPASQPRSVQTPLSSKTLKRKSGSFVFNQEIKRSDPRINVEETKGQILNTNTLEKKTQSAERIQNIQQPRLLQHWNNVIPSETAQQKVTTNIPVRHTQQGRGRQTPSIVKDASVSSREQSFQSHLSRVKSNQENEATRQDVHLDKKRQSGHLLTTPEIKQSASGVGHPKTRAYQNDVSNKCIQNVAPMETDKHSIDNIASYTEMLQNILKSPTAKVSQAFGLFHKDKSSTVLENEIGEMSVDEIILCYQELFSRLNKKGNTTTPQQQRATDNFRKKTSGHVLNGVIKPPTPSSSIQASNIDRLPFKETLSATAILAPASITKATAHTVPYSVQSQNVPKSVAKPAPDTKTLAVQYCQTKPTSPQTRATLGSGTLHSSFIKSVQPPDSPSAKRQLKRSASMNSDNPIKQYGFTRQTQSSLNKINTAVNGKANITKTTNSPERLRSRAASFERQSDPNEANLETARHDEIPIQNDAQSSKLTNTSGLVSDIGRAVSIACNTSNFSRGTKGTIISNELVTSLGKSHSLNKLKDIKGQSSTDNSDKKKNESLKVDQALIKFDNILNSFKQRSIDNACPKTGSSTNRLDSNSQTKFGQVGEVSKSCLIDFNAIKLLSSALNTQNQRRKRVSASISQPSIPSNVQHSFYDNITLLRGRNIRGTSETALQSAHRRKPPVPLRRKSQNLDTSQKELAGTRSTSKENQETHSSGRDSKDKSVSITSQVLKHRRLGGGQIRRTLSGFTFGLARNTSSPGGSERTTLPGSGRPCMAYEPNFPVSYTEICSEPGIAAEKLGVCDQTERSISSSVRIISPRSSFSVPLLTNRNRPHQSCIKKDFKAMSDPHVNVVNRRLSSCNSFLSSNTCNTSSSRASLERSKTPVGSQSVSRQESNTGESSSLGLKYLVVDDVDQTQVTSIKSCKAATIMSVQSECSSPEDASCSISQEDRQQYHHTNTNVAPPPLPKPRRKLRKRHQLSQERDAAGSCSDGSMCEGGVNEKHLIGNYSTVLCRGAFSDGDQAQSSSTPLRNIAVSDINTKPVTPIATKRACLPVSQITADNGGHKSSSERQPKDHSLASSVKSLKIFSQGFDIPVTVGDEFGQSLRDKTVSNTCEIMLNKANVYATTLPAQQKASCPSSPESKHESSLTSRMSWHLSSNQSPHERCAMRNKRDNEGEASLKRITTTGTTTTSSSGDRSRSSHGSNLPRSNQGAVYVSPDSWSDYASTWRKPTYKILQESNDTQSSQTCLENETSSDKKCHDLSMLKKSIFVARPDCSQGEEKNKHTQGRNLYLEDETSPDTQSSKINFRRTRLTNRGAKCRNDDTKGVSVSSQDYPNTYGSSSSQEPQTKFVKGEGCSVGKRAPNSTRSSDGRAKHHKMNEQESRRIHKSALTSSSKSSKGSSQVSIPPYVLDESQETCTSSPAHATAEWRAQEHAPTLDTENSGKQQMTSSTYTVPQQQGVLESCHSDLYNNHTCSQSYSQRLYVTKLPRYPCRAEELSPLFVFLPPTVRARDTPLELHNGSSTSTHPVANVSDTQTPYTLTTSKVISLGHNASSDSMVNKEEYTSEIESVSRGVNKINPHRIATSIDTGIPTSDRGTSGTAQEKLGLDSTYYIRGVGKPSDELEAHVYKPPPQTSQNQPFNPSDSTVTLSARKSAENVVKYMQPDKVLETHDDPKSSCTNVEKKSQEQIRLTPSTACASHGETGDIPEKPQVTIDNPKLLTVSLFGEQEDESPNIIEGNTSVKKKLSRDKSAAMGHIDRKVWENLEMFLQSVRRDSSPKKTIDDQKKQTHRNFNSLPGMTSTNIYRSDIEGKDRPLTLSRNHCVCGNIFHNEFSVEHTSTWINSHFKTAPTAFNVGGSKSASSVMTVSHRDPLQQLSFTSPRQAHTLDWWGTRKYTEFGHIDRQQNVQFNEKHNPAVCWYLETSPDEQAFHKPYTKFASLELHIEPVKNGIDNAPEQQVMPGVSPTRKDVMGKSNHSQRSGLLDNDTLQRFRNCENVFLQSHHQETNNYVLTEDDINIFLGTNIESDKPFNESEVKGYDDEFKRQKVKTNKKNREENLIIFSEASESTSKELDTKSKDTSIHVHKGDEVNSEEAREHFEPPPKLTSSSLESMVLLISPSVTAHPRGAEVQRVTVCKQTCHVTSGGENQTSCVKDSNDEETTISQDDSQNISYSLYASRDECLYCCEPKPNISTPGNAESFHSAEQSLEGDDDGNILKKKPGVFEKPTQDVKDSTVVQAASIECVDQPRSSHMWSLLYSLINTAKQTITNHNNDTKEIKETPGFWDTVDALASRVVDIVQHLNVDNSSSKTKLQPQRKKRKKPRRMFLLRHQAGNRHGVHRRTYRRGHSSSLLRGKNNKTREEILSEVSTDNEEKQVCGSVTDCVREQPRNGEFDVETKAILEDTDIIKQDESSLLVASDAELYQENTKILIEDGKGVAENTAALTSINTKIQSLSFQPIAIAHNAETGVQEADKVDIDKHSNINFQADMGSDVGFSCNPVEIQLENYTSDYHAVGDIKLAISDSEDLEKINEGCFNQSSNEKIGLLPTTKDEKNSCNHIENLTTVVTTKTDSSLSIETSPDIIQPVELRNTGVHDVSPFTSGLSIDDSSEVTNSNCSFCDKYYNIQSYPTFVIHSDTSHPSVNYKTKEKEASEKTLKCDIPADVQTNSRIMLLQTVAYQDVAVPRKESQSANIQSDNSLNDDGVVRKQKETPKSQNQTPIDVARHIGEPNIEMLEHKVAESSGLQDCPQLSYEQGIENHLMFNLSMPKMGTTISPWPIVMPTLRIVVGEESVTEYLLEKKQVTEEKEKTISLDPAIGDHREYENGHKNECNIQRADLERHATCLTPTASATRECLNDVGESGEEIQNYTEWATKENKCFIDKDNLDFYPQGDSLLKEKHKCSENLIEVDKGCISQSQDPNASPCSKVNEHDSTDSDTEDSSETIHHVQTKGFKALQVIKDMEELSNLDKNYYDLLDKCPDIHAAEAMVERDISNADVFPGLASVNIVLLPTVNEEVFHETVKPEDDIMCDIEQLNGSRSDKFMENPGYSGTSPFLARNAFIPLGADIPQQPFSSFCYPQNVVIDDESCDAKKGYFKDPVFCASLNKTSTRKRTNKPRVFDKHQLNVPPFNSRQDYSERRFNSYVNKQSKTCPPQQRHKYRSQSSSPRRTEDIHAFDSRHRSAQPMIFNTLPCGTKTNTYCGSKQHYQNVSTSQYRRGHDYKEKAFDKRAKTPIRVSHRRKARTVKPTVSLDSYIYSNGFLSGDISSEGSPEYMHHFRQEGYWLPTSPSTKPRPRHKQRKSNFHGASRDSDDEAEHNPAGNSCEYTDDYNNEFDIDTYDDLGSFITEMQETTSSCGYWDGQYVRDTCITRDRDSSLTFTHTSTDLLGVPNTTYLGLSSSSLSPAIGERRPIVQVNAYVDNFTQVNSSLCGHANEDGKLDAATQKISMANLTDKSIQTNVVGSLLHDERLKGHTNNEPCFLQHDQRGQSPSQKADAAVCSIVRDFMKFSLTNFVENVVENKLKKDASLPESSRCHGAGMSAAKDNQHLDLSDLGAKERKITKGTMNLNTEVDQDENGSTENVQSNEMNTKEIQNDCFLEKDVTLKQPSLPLSTFGDRSFSGNEETTVMGANRSSETAELPRDGGSSRHAGLRYNDGEKNKSLECLDVLKVTENPLLSTHKISEEDKTQPFGKGNILENDNGGRIIIDLCPVAENRSLSEHKKIPVKPEPKRVYEEPELALESKGSKPSIEHEESEPINEHTELESSLEHKELEPMNEHRDKKSTRAHSTEDSQQKHAPNKSSPQGKHKTELQLMLSPRKMSTPSFVGTLNKTTIMPNHRSPAKLYYNFDENSSDCHVRQNCHAVSFKSDRTCPYSTSPERLTALNASTSLNNSPQKDSLYELTVVSSNSSSHVDYGGLKYVLSQESKTLWKELTHLERSYQSCKECKQQYKKTTGKSLSPFWMNTLQSKLPQYPSSKRGTRPCRWHNSFLTSEHHVDPDQQGSLSTSCNDKPTSSKSPGRYILPRPKDFIDKRMKTHQEKSNRFGIDSVKSDNDRETMSKNSVAFTAANITNDTGKGGVPSALHKQGKLLSSPSVTPPGHIRVVPHKDNDTSTLKRKHVPSTSSDDVPPVKRASQSSCKQVSPKVDDSLRVTRFRKSCQNSWRISTGIQGGAFRSVGSFRGGKTARMVRLFEIPSSAPSHAISSVCSSVKDCPGVDGESAESAVSSSNNASNDTYSYTSTEQLDGLSWERDSQTRVKYAFEPHNKSIGTSNGKKAKEATNEILDNHFHDLKSVTRVKKNSERPETSQPLTAEKLKTTIPKTNQTVPINEDHQSASGVPTNSVLETDSFLNSYRSQKKKEIDEDSEIGATTLQPKTSKSRPVIYIPQISQMSNVFTPIISNGDPKEYGKPKDADECIEALGNILSEIRTTFPNEVLSSPKKCNADFSIPHNISHTTLLGTDFNSSHTQLSSTSEKSDMNLSRSNVCNAQSDIGDMQKNENKNQLDEQRSNDKPSHYDTRPFLVVSDAANKSVKGIKDDTLSRSRKRCKRRRSKIKLHDKVKRSRHHNEPQCRSNHGKTREYTRRPVSRQNSCARTSFKRLNRRPCSSLTTGEHKHTTTSLKLESNHNLLRFYSDAGLNFKIQPVDSWLAGTHLKRYALFSNNNVKSELIDTSKSNTLQSGDNVSTFKRMNKKEPMLQINCTSVDFSLGNQTKPEINKNIEPSTSIDHSSSVITPKRECFAPDSKTARFEHVQQTIDGKTVTLHLPQDHTSPYLVENGKHGNCVPNTSSLPNKTSGVNDSTQTVPHLPAKKAADVCNVLPLPKTTNLKELEKRKDSSWLRLNRNLVAIVRGSGAHTTSSVDVDSKHSTKEKDHGVATKLSGDSHQKQLLECTCGNGEKSAHNRSHTGCAQRKEMLLPPNFGCESNASDRLFNEAPVKCPVQMKSKAEKSKRKFGLKRILFGKRSS